MSEIDFERRVERALRAPVPTSARAKQAIMESVRRAAREGAPGKTLIFPGGRAARHSLIGLALAAGIGSITTMSSFAPTAPDARPMGVVTSAIIGDSVVDRFRDTLRLVRLMFDAPNARHVAVAGEFNGWNDSSTQMQRDVRTGKWAVTLALKDGEHRYAIVVDNTRQTGFLHVARAQN
ncbi:MAG: hypothetical protein ABI664_12180 [bacterium]